MGFSFVHFLAPRCFSLFLIRGSIVFTSNISKASPSILIAVGLNPVTLQRQIYYRFGKVVNKVELENENPLLTIRPLIKSNIFF